MLARRETLENDKQIHGNQTCSTVTTESSKRTEKSETLSYQRGNGKINKMKRILRKITPRQRFNNHKNRTGPNTPNILVPLESQRVETVTWSVHIQAFQPTVVGIQVSWSANLCIYIFRFKVFFVKSSKSSPILILQKFGIILFISQSKLIFHDNNGLRWFKKFKSIVASSIQISE